MTHINGHAVRWYSFKKLAERKRELEASLREVKNQMAAEQEPLLDELAESGLRSAKLEDGSTIYIHRSVFVGAKDTDYDRACDAFADAGMGEFVQRRFNVNTVSAWYREATADGESIPSTLEDVLDVNERVSLRVRSS
jgi:hypothetical protein